MQSSSEQWCGRTAAFFHILEGIAMKVRTHVKAGSDSVILSGG